MELFTLGIGNYSENDVKEAARAFTGWTVDGGGNFEFRERTHDAGSKTFLGHTGNFKGDDILQIILQQKQCAKYITTRIYRHFVNDIADEAIINKLSEDFYGSGYDISKLMRTIFTADWFYDEKNIGVKIKPPIVFMANIVKNFSIQFEDNRGLIGIQKILGQVLLNPANVAGWPEGKNWIDSSSLMLRLNMPYILTNANEFYVKPKDDDDTMMGMPDTNERVKMKQIQTTVDWNSVIKAFESVPREGLIENISSVVLQTQSKVNKNILEKYIDKEAREKYIKTTIVELMSTPEYQLC